MSSPIFSLDHRLNELRQVGDELRAARYADQVRRAGRRTSEPTFATSFRNLLSGLTDRGHSSRLATH
ncbi:MAG: hypothetical protein HY263_00075 [Chloroflexi bacterium]|nr:hypothetical protein [Chloroflexota bacterium]